VNYPILSYNKFESYIYVYKYNNYLLFTKISIHRYHNNIYYNETHYFYLIISYNLILKTKHNISLVIIIYNLNAVYCIL